MQTLPDPRAQMSARACRAVVLERNLLTIQRQRRRVLLAAIEAQDGRLATVALAELGAMAGAW